MSKCQVLGLASTVFMVFVWSIKNFSIVILSIQSYLGFAVSGSHAQVLKTTKLLAAMPVGEFGSVNLTNGEGWMFLNGNEHAMLPGPQQFADFYSAVERGQYLVYHDTNVYEALLADTDTNMMANDHLHDYWRHVACVNEMVMELLLHGNSPSITPGDMPVATAAVGVVPWAENTTIGLKTVIRGAFVVLTLSQSIPFPSRGDCYNASELHSKTGLRLLSIWGGSAMNIYNEADGPPINEGTIIEDNNHTVCIGAQIKYTVDEFTAVASADRILEGVSVASADVTTRLYTVTSKAQYDKIIGDGTVAFPLRDIMPIPVEGRVKVRQALVVSVSSPLLTISNALLGIALLIMMLSYGEWPDRDLRFWLNIMIESPTMLWILSLASIGTVSSASQWLPIAMDYMRGHADFNSLLNFANIAWIVRGSMVLMMVAIRALLSLMPGVNYRMAQLRMSNAAIPTTVAALFLHFTGTTSDGQYSTNFSLIMCSGVIMAFACFFFNRITFKVTSDNYICRQVNRRIFTVLTYEGDFMTEKYVDGTGRKWHVLVLDSKWRLAATLLIDYCIWNTKSKISIEETGGLIWGHKEMVTPVLVGGKADAASSIPHKSQQLRLRKWLRNGRPPAPVTSDVFTAHSTVIDMHAKKCILGSGQQY